MQNCRMVQIYIILKREHGKKRGGSECIISAVNFALNVMACVSPKEAEAITEMRLESFLKHQQQH